MIYRKEDKDGDYVFGEGDSEFLTQSEAVAQAIITSLKLLKGEWWENVNNGLPLWQSILGQPGSEVNKASSAMSTQEAAKYLAGLDSALQQANESLYHTITTQAGVVSQNPNLDGFIAENYHAQTFNLNAEAAGSPYRAKVLEPVEGGYTKNSVDIVHI